MILDSLRAHLQRFVCMPSEAALDALTLWIAHTHIVDETGNLAFYTTPRLALLSDLPGSGKTIVLDMIRRLARNSEQILDPTPATIVQLINEQRATILVDEIDVYFGGGAAHASARAILNGGYRTGSKWHRANGEPRPIFSAVALAGLSAKFRSAEALRPLRERSIMIDMQKGRPEEIYRARFHDALSSALQRDLARWAHKHTLEILEIIPEDLEGLQGRLLEVAEPLLQVADVAGAQWPERAQRAISELLLGQPSEDESEDLDTADMLARDLRTVFGSSKKLSTVAVVQGLYALPGSLWRTLWPHETTAPRELASMLRGLGIEPRPVDVAGRKFRGYHRAELELLWPEFRDANDVTAVAVTG